MLLISMHMINAIKWEPTYAQYYYLFNLSLEFIFSPTCFGTSFAIIKGGLHQIT
jgi:hypothetical protein